jgi:hypothetical protein
MKSRKAKTSRKARSSRKARTTFGGISETYYRGLLESEISELKAQQGIPSRVYQSALKMLHQPLTQYQKEFKDRRSHVRSVVNRDINRS